MPSIDTVGSRGWDYQWKYEDRAFAADLVLADSRKKQGFSGYRPTTARMAAARLASTHKLGVVGPLALSTYMTPKVTTRIFPRSPANRMNEARQH